MCVCNQVLEPVSILESVFAVLVTYSNLKIWTGYTVLHPGEMSVIMNRAIVWTAAHPAVAVLRSTGPQRALSASAAVSPSWKLISQPGVWVKFPTGNWCRNVYTQQYVAYEERK